MHHCSFEMAHRQLSARATPAAHSASCPGRPYALHVSAAAAPVSVQVLVSQPVFQVLLIQLQVLADTLLSQVAIGVVMLVSLATNTVDMDRNNVIFVHTNKLERKGLSITNISLPGTRLR